MKLRSLHLVHSCACGVRMHVLLRADEEKPVAAAAAVGAATHKALVTLYPDDSVGLRKALFATTRLLAGSVDDLNMLGRSLAWGNRVGITIAASREGDGFDAGEPFEV